MQTNARPTWPDLQPILRGAPHDPSAVWAVITRHAEFGLGAVRQVLARQRDVLARHGGSADLAAGEVFGWACERLVARVRKPPPGLPVSERRDGSPGDATAWLRKVWANLARDWCKAERRRWAREARLDEARPPAPPPPPPAWDDAQLRSLQNLLKNPGRSGVSPTHVLAYLCLKTPDAVVRQRVDDAAAFDAAAGSRSGDKGLARSASDTWTHLQDWRDRYDGATSTAEARATLAWILRSGDAGDPRTWRARDYAAMRTATNTVSRWASRCAKVLELPW